MLSAHKGAFVQCQAWWRELCQTFGDDEAVIDGVYADLVARYEANGRFYHRFDHVIHVLQDAQALYSDSPMPAALQFAAWFHDVIYDPRRSDNEMRSAEFAAATLPQLGVVEPLIKRVTQLVLCTQTHQAPPDDLEAVVLLDADLSILGADPAVYTQYAQAIRQEYAHIPEEVYRVGRIYVLDTFLQRPRIYHTDQAFNAREEQARQNLERERAHIAAATRIPPDVTPAVD